MRTLLLALRNLMRNLRRSAMTLFAMVIGLMAVMLFGGYIQDIKYQLQTNFVGLSGHIQIQHDGYFRFGSGNPGAYGIHDYERILKVVREDPVLAPMLVVATPTLQFGGIAGNFGAGVSRTVLANGTVVGEQTKMREWNDYDLHLPKHHVSLAGSPPDSVVVGTGVARVLQLCAELKVENCAAPAKPKATGAPGLPDDIADLAAAQKTEPKNAADATRIEVLASNAHGAPNVAAVRVLRAEFQGVKELDDVYMSMHLSQAQRLLFGNDRPQVTAIALQFHHTADLVPARARLQELLETSLKGEEPLALIDYEVLNPFYGQTISMFDAIFGFIAVLIGGIVLFTVGNTMSMAVVERTSEIGTLRSIGLRRSGIRAMFLTEGLVIGLLGAVVGIVASIGAAAIVNSLGLTWLPPTGTSPVPLSVRVLGEFRMMVVSSVGLIVVAALSAALPAARAARMNIVDALRHV